METQPNLFWEVGPALAKETWQGGESLESPVFTTSDGASWWLEFYPAGDDATTDILTFWLNRSDTRKEVNVTFVMHLCFYSVPVRLYSLEHTFEEGEENHKWVVNDVKNLAKLKIFIPPSSLCILGYLTVCESSKKYSN